MALDQNAKLFDVLARGYHLNTQLQALLARPLDSHGQQEAMAFSHELSQVFEVSMSMLNISSTVTRVKTTPEIRTGDSSGGVIIQATKDKRARIDSGEVVTPVKRSREEGVTRKEITASPHKDGYQWRKYGQKNIQNCSFVRYYFKCNRDRRCEAKKRVQQQDVGGPGQRPPVFEVTYVNEHTCHVLRRATANGHDDARMASPPRTIISTNRFRVLGVVDAARDAGGGGGGGELQLDDVSLFPCMAAGGGGAQLENETIVSCLADIIRGAAPSPWPTVAAAVASASDHPAASAYVPPPPVQASAGRHAPASVVEDDGGAMMMTMIDTDTDLSWDPSSFCGVGEGDADHELMMIDHRDMHVDVARHLADTEWPRHTSAGAWHYGGLCPQI